MEATVSFKPYEQTDDSLKEQKDDSLKDDSGTDILYIDLGVSTPDGANDSTSSEAREFDNTSNSDDVAKKEADVPERQFEPVIIPQLPKKESVPAQAPVISEYPYPAMPSFPIPPPSYYPSYPMFYPRMISAPYPAYLPPSFLPQRSTQLQNYRSLVDLATTVQTKPLNDGRTSPADSMASSGVSSSSSPSPTRSSPQASPQTPKTPKQTPGGRTSYTPHQVRAMEKVFSENRYPDYDVLEKMSADLGIPAKKIKVWFQNKRARNKHARCPDASVNNMAAMMSSAPVYSFPVHSPMMSLPVPPQAPLLMPPHPYPTPFQPFMY